MSLRKPRSKKKLAPEDSMVVAHFMFSYCQNQKGLTLAQTAKKLAISETLAKDWRAGKFIISAFNFRLFCYIFGLDWDQTRVVMRKKLKYKAWLD